MIFLLMWFQEEIMSYRFVLAWEMTLMIGSYFDSQRHGPHGSDPADGSVDIEFVITPPLEAGRAYGNALASGNAPNRLVCCWLHHSFVPAYRF
jgi:hypothetical protein